MDQLKTIISEAWRDRLSPFEWSMKIYNNIDLDQLNNQLLNDSSKINNQNGDHRSDSLMNGHSTSDSLSSIKVNVETTSSLLCEILLNLLYIGKTPSPLLVSYLRYALVIKLIDFNEFLLLVTKYSSPSKPHHFSLILDIVQDFINNTHTIDNITSKTITTTILQITTEIKINQNTTTTTTNNINNNIANSNINVNGHHVNGINHNINGSNHINGNGNGIEINTDSFIDQQQQHTQDQPTNKRKRGGKNSKLIKDERLKKRKEYEKVDENEEDKQEESNEDISNSTAISKHQLPLSNYQKHLLASTKITNLLFTTILYYYQQQESHQPQDSKQLYENSIKSLNILNIIQSNQKITSFIYLSKFEFINEFQQLTTSFNELSKILNQQHNNNNNELFSNIKKKYVKVFTELKKLIKSKKVLPMDGLLQLIYNPGQIDNQSILSIQLLIEQELTGNTIPTLEFDYFYKLQSIQSIRSLSNTDILLEILKYSFQRLSKCEDPSTPEFRKIKLFILFKIPLFYSICIKNNSKNSNSSLGFIENAILYISQYSTLSHFEDNFILSFIQILIIKNLIDIKLIKCLLPMHQSEIESIENELNSSSMLSEITLDNLTNVQLINTKEDVNRIKEILESIVVQNPTLPNEEHQFNTYQYLVNLIKPQLLNTFDYQDQLLQIIFQILDQSITNTNNSVIACYILSMLTDPQIIDTIDIHGYTLDLIIKCVEYCFLFSNQLNNHTFFTIPFNLLNNLLILYDVKNNDYNLDLIKSKLKSKQYKQEGYYNDFIIWIYNSFKDSEINFGRDNFSNEQSLDFQFLKVLLDRDKDRLEEILPLDTFTPWNIVLLIPNSLFLLMSYLEKNPTSHHKLEEILPFIAQNIPYSSLVIGSFMIKYQVSELPSTYKILIDQDQSMILSFRPVSSSQSNSNQDFISFHLSGNINDTIRLIFYPYAGTSEDIPLFSYQTILFGNKFINQYYSDIQPSISIQNIIEGFLLDTTPNLKSIPVEAIKNIVDKTGVYNTTNIICKTILDIIVSSQNTSTYCIRAMELGGFLLGSVIGIESIPILLNSIVSSCSYEHIFTSFNGLLLSYFCLTSLMYSNTIFYIQQQNPIIIQSLRKFLNVLNESLKRMVVFNPVCGLITFLLSMVTQLIHVSDAYNQTVNNNNPNNNTTTIFNIFNILPIDQQEDLSVTISNFSNYFLAISIFDKNDLKYCSKLLQN